jgi:septal ring factor EnvC (AmiA/AmiB activator)
MNWLGRRAPLAGLAGLVLLVAGTGAPTAGPAADGGAAAAQVVAPADDADNALPQGADGPPDASSGPSVTPASPDAGKPLPPAPAPWVYAGQVQDTSKLRDSQSALADLENSISVSKARAAELKQQIDAMQGDAAKQSAALIAAAQRVKLAEIEVKSMAERLSGIISAEIRVRSRLDGADGNISNVLAALERLSRNPPPALIVDPSDALRSERGATLIGAILPQLRAKADAIAADLARLGALEADAEKQQEQLKANFAVLEEEQLKIATLIAARKQNQSVVADQLAKEQQQADELTARADQLKSVVAALTRRAQAVDEAAAAAHAAEQGQAPPRLDAETIKLALANTKRVAPAIPFEEARGYLELPAKGLDLVDFGASDGFGGTAKGVSMVTSSKAQVVAPADGWVVYKGPYLNYGQIVVLNPGQGYTILLAGLDAVNVNVGQFVRMGQPVGTMGSRTIGRTIATSAGVSQPTLYIELRKNNAPIDPSGWWASSHVTENG